MESFVTPKQLAQLAGITDRAITKAISTSVNGKCLWRGATLEITVTTGNGTGRDGKNYQVAVESLPPELLAKYKALNPVKPVLNTDLTVGESSLSMYKTPTSPASTEVPARAYSPKILWGYWAAAKEKNQLIAQRRLDTLLRIEARVSLEGMTKTDAIRSDVFETREIFNPLLTVMDEDEAEQRTGRILTSERTVYEWFGLVKEKSRTDWLPALLPAHVGKTGGLEYNPEIFDFFCKHYLHESQPGFAHIYKFTKKHAEQQGWGVMPSINTLRREFNRRVSPQVRDLGRLGKDAESFKRITPPVVRDKSNMRALEWINGDGYDHELYMIFPDGEIARATTWLWQDVYSGMFLGFCVDKTENSDILRISLRNTIRDYGLGINGKPFKVTTDNTPNAAAKLFTGQSELRFRYKHKPDDPIGIFKRLDIDFRPSTPGEPQTKPIERKNKDIKEYVDKDPYLVKNSHTATKTTLEYSFFIQRLREILDELNRTVSESPVCRGIYSPYEVFQESIAHNAVLKATPEQLNMLLLCVKSIKVDSANGSLSFWNNIYWNEELGQLAGKPAKSVMIEYDPYDLRQDINVYHLNGLPICTAKYIPSSGFGSESDGREYKRKKKALQKATEKQLKSLRAVKDLERKADVSKLPVELPKAKIITPVRTKPVVGMRAAQVVTPAPPVSAEIVPITKKPSQAERTRNILKGLEITQKQRAVK